MALNKRTKIERKRDLVVISKLYLDGYNQTEIAKKLPEMTGANYLLSQQQIAHDLGKLFEQWKGQYNQNYNEKINLELARIDAEVRKINEVEELARESFRLSKEKSIKKTKEVRAGSESEGGNKIAKLSHTEEDRYGNSKFLEIMLNCSVERRNLGVERRKLLGLDAAIKLDVVSNTSANHNYTLMSEEQLDAHIAELQKLIEGDSGDRIIDITPEQE